MKNSLFAFLGLFLAFTANAYGATREDLLVFDADRSGNFEIYRSLASVNGLIDLHQLTKDSKYDSFWGRVSPDREHILFYRTPKGTHDTDFTQASLWVMNVDGSNQRMIIDKGGYGWSQHGHAEWSPDGAHLVMFGGSRINPQIFVTDTDGKNPRQLTNRGGTNIDPSWAPDGQSIVFISCPSSFCTQSSYEVFTLTFKNAAIQRLTDNSKPDYDPYYSRDGKMIGWLELVDSQILGAGVWDILLMNNDGSNQHRLVNDKFINSKPQWSRDDKEIFFHRFMPGVSPFWNIWSIRPDGTGLRQVTHDLGNAEYPSE